MGSATKIKGITVEIGGDTTKLGKAIEDTQVRSKGLQKELNDVNRLLKLDPSNVELLAQKQDILQEAVSESAQKLKMLESAQADVERAFAEKKIDTDQYRAFRRDIEKARMDCKSYEKQLENATHAQDNAEGSADDLGDAVEDAGEKAERSGDGFTVLRGTLSNLASSAIGAAIDGMRELAEAARETQELQAKLNTAYDQAGFSGETAAAAYSKLYGALGDADQATEASQLLAQLADNTEQVDTWTRIATGVVGTFGDSLPVESLIEASNETAKVGTVTGTLADALNWVGVSEDEFNSKLAACSDQTERTALITDTLNGLYDEAAGKYTENNAALITSRQNQAALNAEISGLVQSVDMAKSSLMSQFMPSITEVIDGLSAIASGDESGLAMVRSGVQDFCDQLRDSAPQMADTASDMLQLFIGAILDNAPTLIETGIYAAASFISSFFDPRNVEKTAGQAVDMIFALVESLTDALEDVDVIAAIWNIGVAIVEGIWNSLKKNMSSRLETWTNEVSAEYGLDGLKPSTNGSHYGGLRNVPFDGYISELHKGERVLTAAESQALDSLFGARVMAVEPGQSQEAPLDATAIIDRMDRLESAILGMRLYLDGRTLVGGIRDDMDIALGAQRVSAERRQL